MGSRMLFDIAGSYPTGLMAQLGPYNTFQELINTQAKYAENQADISSQQHAEYALTNLQIEQSGTIVPVSERMRIDAMLHINGINQINYANQNSAKYANIQYTNAYNLEKACRDASYSAYLVTQAFQINNTSLSTTAIVSQLINSPININSMHPMYPSTISTITSLEANYSQTNTNNLNNSIQNLNSYIANTQSLLEVAIDKSVTVSANLTLIAALNTLTKAVAQMFSFPLSDISSKQTLITQNIPSISLNNAITACNIALSLLNAVISKFNDNTVDLTSFSNSAAGYAKNLDDIARSNDKNMYFREKIQTNLIAASAALVKNNTNIPYPSNYPYNAKEIAMTGIVEAAAAAISYERALGALTIDAATTKEKAATAAEILLATAADAAAAVSPIEARAMAVNADKSAENARNLSNAINSLIIACDNTPTFETMVVITALNALSSVRSMLATVGTLTANTSAHNTFIISRRASNTINGELQLFIEKETAALEAAADANSILTLLNTAYYIQYSIQDESTIQAKHRAANAAAERAGEISEKLKHKAFLINRTSLNLITSQKLATQTSVANKAGALNVNYASRLYRNSRGVYPSPPTAYSSFKADIRANTFVPIRPSLDELVFKNRIQPLRLDSVTTISDSREKVIQSVQQILENSRQSFRK